MSTLKYKINICHHKERIHIIFKIFLKLYVIRRPFAIRCMCLILFIPDYYRLRICLKTQIRMEERTDIGDASTIWKFLDNMYVSNPAAYKNFIDNVLKEGKDQNMGPPMPHIAIQTIRVSDGSFMIHSL